MCLPNIKSYADYKEYFTIPTPENIQCPFSLRNLNYNQGDLINSLIGSEGLYQLSGNRMEINFNNVEELSNNIEGNFTNILFFCQMRF